MKRQITIFFSLLLFAFFLPKIILSATGTILATHSYAWSNNVGWINFKDTIVGDSALSGYAWSANNGWIKMNPSNGGVFNNGQGVLSGYAWGENLGWINFSGVSIDSNGNFVGTASGDLIGSLNFDCTNCDVQTDWRVTPPTGGGGGGDTTPPPDEDPPPEEVHDMPIGSVQINSGASYTNSRDVTLQLVSDYTDSYAIAVTNDFSSVTYVAITNSVSFSLASGDGNKTVYVSLKNQYGTYVASDSIILDTISPNAPVISQIDNGIENGIAIRPPKLYGTAEANSQIIITKTTVGAQSAGFSLADVTTYYATTNAQGSWNFTFAAIFAPGNYAISAKAQDAAGNISVSSVVSNLAIPLVVTPPEEDLPPDDDNLPPDEDLPPDDTLPPDETGENDTGNQENTNNTNDNTGSSNGSENNSSDGSGSATTSTSEKFFTSSTIPNIIKEVGNVVDNVSNQVSIITENITKNISNSVEVNTKKFVDTAKNVSKKIVEVVELPEVQNVNKNVVTPVVTTVTVVNIASSGFGMAQVVNFLRVFFGQFFLVFRRKKQKKWGVLYNSFTKKPIDLATIRLVDSKTGKIVRSVVTDTEGRYILTAYPGDYKIVVFKNGFEGFSKHLQALSEDSAFINLYHGEIIKVTDESEINYNIPLDPIEDNKSYLQVIKDKIYKSVRLVISSIGLVFSIASFVITPVWWVGALVIFQVLLFISIRHFSYKKLPSSFGVITTEGNSKSLANVAVRVFDATFNKLVETTVSDHKGRYAVLLGPNKYYVTYEKNEYKKKKSPLLDFSSKSIESNGGILVRDESLEEENPSKK
ncbi:MAG: hypothetical protein ACD_18C00149G0004 [uncultured bacterium]|nr:MAG: hypothetical protein ACD_18C00149G0004 [uncultured bacterium]OGH84736.1 MAG: hypothetical protein A2488_03085 [Candidatus Magasanikbacteria bacterium RIFOXYC12_FULL_32_21b]OGH88890.1 MAG: hypothetical protein A2507_03315 [Candidatus Magasanikbacteria bacterium RIFOXYD12_FULL_33_17]